MNIGKETKVRASVVRVSSEMRDKLSHCGNPHWQKVTPTKEKNSRHLKTCHTIETDIKKNLGVDKCEAQFFRPIYTSIHCAKQSSFP